jgi:NAD(P)-dependent dehydrogenase (short-subunit alcohol dehydrogenase family)
VTGASQGIGAGIVKALVERSFNVVASSRKATQSTEIAASDRIALVDGDMGEPATASRIVETALSRFESIDVWVNNAGLFFAKPFTDYTAEDRLVTFDIHPPDAPTPWVRPCPPFRRASTSTFPKRACKRSVAPAPSSPSAPMATPAT